MARKVRIQGDYIELQKLLKFAGIAATGGDAKQLIEASLVQVNGAVESRRSRKLASGDIVRVEGVAEMIEIA
ncbi:MAG: RNA-binding S4 domain-containing protein [Fimbriimonadales bacterium]